MKNVVFFLIFLSNLWAQIGRSEFLESPQTTSLRLEMIPPRPQKAISGSEFARRTSGMSGSERQQLALKELRCGNIPEFLRNLKPVQLSYTLPGGETIIAIIWVTPDYLAIGSDEDCLRMPLTYPSAIAIAEEFGCILPTRKMVDMIYEQSALHLKPQSLPPGPEMRSSAYYLRHQRKIETQCTDNFLGELISGHKKDVVLTNRLYKKPHRIAIYGWHRLNGEPIQPLSTFHGARYADYSHGVRLIYQTMWIDGVPRSIFEILQDPLLAPILTYEGSIPNPYSLMQQKLTD